MKKQRHVLLSLILPIILIVLLSILVLNFSTISHFVTRATGTPANITVNASLELEEINPIWQAYAQGGEASNDMLAPVVSEVKNLNPKYIRIDHIYSHYNLVSKNNGQIKMDFTELDKIVGSILKTNALPFFSLSYMPPSLTSSGNITDQPVNYNDWAYVVEKTIEHYSGINNRNLNNVYYEVWNEPDLFGSWKIYGSKNYLTLYQFAITGAQNAQNVNSFKIGGPATTALYKNWIESLLKFVTDNNLRLDFLSWHRYTTNPNQYSLDISEINQILNNYPGFITIPKLITEYGLDSENNPGYDGNLAAAHALATVRQSLFGYTYLFAFELVDGKSPQNQEFWGRWGLITNPEMGKKTKPRYRAFMLLNQMSTGKRLLLSGEGTWVTGFAVKNDKNIKVLLVNYDQDNVHTENVPVTIENISPGNYIFKRTRLGQNTTSQNLEITNTFFSTQEIMQQNSALLLELTPDNEATKNIP